MSPRTDLTPTILDTPCREWRGPRSPRGYGIITRDGKPWRLHRWIWTLANGVIPDGMFVCHRCDNPACYRLDHLFLGTHAENMADMMSKGRSNLGGNNRDKTHCKRGHEFDEANTRFYRKRSGGIVRFCRACAALRGASVVALIVVALLAILGRTTTAEAQTIKACGGQNAAPQDVPYTCNLPGIDITYQGVTRHFSAVVTADGQIVTVTFTMSAPVPVDVPIRIVHHEGISGAGGASDNSQGVIPAGQTVATLTDSSPCREGQLDVKAVYIGNGQSQGRIGGPWIRNGTDCTTTTTTTTSSAPTTLVTTTTTTVTVTTSSVPGAPTTTSHIPPSASSVPGTGTLPPTGSGPGVIVGYGLAVVFVGLCLGIVVYANRITDRKVDGDA